MSSPWREKYTFEVERGRKAEVAGNAGMARVCARRAAGHLLRAFLQLHGLLARGPSALDVLHQVSEDVGLDEHTRKIAQGFLMRITPEHVLPVDINLLDELIVLERALFPEEPN